LSFFVGYLFGRMDPTPNDWSGVTSLVSASAARLPPRRSRQSQEEIQ
jgi:hypothetical protein